ncbi:hypothetical protein RvY_14149 [Ramazzottius varieornatus]|uniref:Uncharacterized protein n=1 Tax=Ramazzottius varieornatus TaxID=947166 RepID=A0A1D1VYT7_RAMVA|nr:hypothetical protein RvY_14149 [Ramazzottius varieornatus]
MTRIVYSQTLLSSVGSHDGPPQPTVTDFRHTKPMSPSQLLLEPHSHFDSAQFRKRFLTNSCTTENSNCKPPTAHYPRRTGVMVDDHAKEAQSAGLRAGGGFRGRNPLMSTVQPTTPVQMTLLVQTVVPMQILRALLPIHRGTGHYTSLAIGIGLR